MTAAHGIWLFMAAYVLVAVALLVAGNGRSLRLRSLLMPPLMVLVLRGAAWQARHTFDAWDLVGLGVVGMLLIVAVGGRGAWLVRTTREELMTELSAACGSVRISSQQGSFSELTLLLKESTAAIRIRRLAAGLQVLILPKTANRKVKLLVDLLRKRYPRFWPRFSVPLSRSKE